LKKSAYIYGVLNALKTWEYCFGFGVIIISVILTLVLKITYNNIEHGAINLFITGTMEGNVLLQITAPVLPIFVCINNKSIFACKNKNEILTFYKSKRVLVQVLTNVTIGISVFILSFLFILFAVLILFPGSAGGAEQQIGFFKELYAASPTLFIFVYIIHAAICGGAYALLGTSLKLLFGRTDIALFVPLVFYGCFSRIVDAMPIFAQMVYYITPMYTFDIASIDVPLEKNVAEIAFVIIMGLTMLYSSYRKHHKLLLNHKERIANVEDTGAF